MLESGLELKSSGSNLRSFFFHLPMIGLHVYLLFVGMKNSKRSYLGGLGWHRRLRKHFGSPRQNKTLFFEFSYHMAAYPKLLLVLCHGKCFKLEVPSDLRSLNALPIPCCSRGTWHSNAESAPCLLLDPVLNQSNGSFGCSLLSLSTPWSGLRIFIPLTSPLISFL